MPACRAWPRPPGGTTPSWYGASPRWGCATRRGPRRRVSCSLRPVGRAQRARLEQLTAATGLFRPDEVAIAVELLDDALDGDEEYHFLGAFAGEELVGYACWGPTPGTTGTYDLYWIVVDPAWQGKRVGTQLLASVEAQLATYHGRLIVVETSSRADYGPTRAFYERRGYARAALIPGYYAAGDDLVIYLKDLTHGVVARATARSEEQRLNSSHRTISYAVFCLKKKSFDRRSRARPAWPCAGPLPVSPPRVPD